MYDYESLNLRVEGLRTETTRLEQCGNKQQQYLMADTATNEPAGMIDDVLTFTLLSIAISGGDFKSDCLKWWCKAVRLTLALGLNRDDELEHSSGLPFTAMPEPYQGYDTLLQVKTQKERRRIFCQLYCLDRHLILSFNMTLKIPDEICAVFGECKSETSLRIATKSSWLTIYSPASRYYLGRSGHCNIE